MSFVISVRKRGVHVMVPRHPLVFVHRLDDGGALSMLGKTELVRLIRWSVTDERLRVHEIVVANF